MSYCRWSSDNWKSDIYCYESSAGYEIQVASIRLVGEVPEVPQLSDSNIEEWQKKYREQEEWMETAVRESLNLGFDGESFLCSTPQETLDKLLWLRELGYHVPQFAIDCLEEEVDGR